MTPISGLSVNQGRGRAWAVAAATYRSHLQPSMKGPSSTHGSMRMKPKLMGQYCEASHQSASVQKDTNVRMRMDPLLAAMVQHKTGGAPRLPRSMGVTIELRME